MKRETILKAIGWMALMVSLCIFGLYFYNGMKKPGSLVIAFTSLVSGIRLLHNPSDER